MTERHDTWYFIGSDGTEFGPYPRDTLRAMRAAGQVGASDLVWSPGMDGWKPYSDVLPPPLPPAPSSGTIQPAEEVATPSELPGGLLPLAASGAAATDSSPHPWRRYFSRIADIFTFGLFSAIAASTIVAAVAPDRLDGMLAVLENEFIASVGVLLAWVPVEAFALSVFGTTPGRSLFGIVIRDREGEALGFDRSLERSARVVFQGLGMGIPLLVLFTQWFAYRRLTTTGTTLWDEAVGAVVTHKPWGPARTAACILALLFGVLVIGGLAAIGTRA